MPVVLCIEDIQALVKEGFSDWKTLGRVKVTEKDNLLLFNYQNDAIYEGVWNPFECLCRGLILEKGTGVIVTRSFDKFFNWLEGGRKSEASIKSITEKIDGTLVNISIYQEKFLVTTRGSFDGEQAIYAQNLSKEYIKNSLLKVGSFSLDKRYTYIFEMITPRYRIVIDYGEIEQLVLLAIRNTETGEYLPIEEVDSIANNLGFPRPSKYIYNTPEEILSTLPNLNPNKEGYVVEFTDGQRFKFKGDEYLRLHKLICGLSPKNTIIACIEGKVEDIRKSVPEEFLEKFNEWLYAVDSAYFLINQELEEAWGIYNHSNKNQKDFALWVINNYKDISHLLFAKWHGKALEPIILKDILKNRDKWGLGDFD